MNNSKPADLSWFTASTLKFTPHLIELLILAATVRLIGLVQPFVFQTLIDRVLPFQRVDSLTLILFVLLGATLFSACINSVSSYLGAHMANRITSELGYRIYKHTLHLPLQTIQKWQVGEVLARVQEVDTVRKFLTGTIANVVLDLMFAIIYVAALLSISPFLTLIVVVMLPAQMVVFAVIGPFLRTRMQSAFQASSIHQARFVEIVGNIVSLKSHVSENTHTARVSETLDLSLDASFKAEKINILNGFFGEILRNLSVILIIYFGSLLVFENQITLGQLIAFHLLAGYVSGPILNLSNVWEQWQGLRIARLRLGDLLNEKTETETKKDYIHVPQVETFSVSELGFAYTTGKPVLENLSHEFVKGTPNLIIGESGAGKSTLAKLLAGLYKPQTGIVHLNQHDLSQADPSQIRKIIAYVPQDPTLFAGTIRDNFLMIAPDATEEHIHHALEMSASMGIFERLPDGLHTDVGERGGLLSGGQRQRISIACSLLKNPEILVLDEPTSALDDEAANKVMAHLIDLAKSKMIIIITHHPDLVKGKKNILNLKEPNCA